MINKKVTLESMNVTIETVSKNLETVSKNMGKMQEQVGSLEKTVGSMEQRMGSVEQKIGSIELHIKELPTKKEMQLSIDNAVEDLARSTAKEFGIVHSSIYKVEKKVDSIDKKLDYKISNLRISSIA